MLSLCQSSVALSNPTCMTLAAAPMKTFLRLDHYSGCSCELPIFVAMRLKFFLKIPSLWPTSAKPKLSSFHQEWHLFVQFPFLSIISHFPNFQGCLVCNSFWLTLSRSHLQSWCLCRRHCLLRGASSPVLLLTVEICIASVWWYQKSAFPVSRCNSW